MPERPQPTWVFHFTHIDHVSSIVARGLLSDRSARMEGVLTTEIGELGIKATRRKQTVHAGRGGNVADYVPFYFAPRSPMLYSIGMGNVSSYQDGTEEFIYILSTLETLDSLGHTIVLTDRNAALRYTTYRDFDPSDRMGDGFVDWDLMRERYWYNTPEDPTRKERRMAETLVHERVQWGAVIKLGAKSPAVANELVEFVGISQHRPEILVKPEWYF